MGNILSSEGLFFWNWEGAFCFEYKTTLNTSAVCSFLGLVTYCGKVIPNFTTITEPLRWLTRQKTDVVWNGEQESAFSKVKTFISKAPVLPYFHPAFEIKAVADASNQNLGAVLLRKNPKISVSTSSFLPVVLYRTQIPDIPKLNGKH